MYNTDPSAAKQQKKLQESRDNGATHDYELVDMNVDFDIDYRPFFFNLVYIKNYNLRNENFQKGMYMRWLFSMKTVGSDHLR